MFSLSYCTVQIFLHFIFKLKYNYIISPLPFPSCLVVRTSFLPWASPRDLHSLPVVQHTSLFSATLEQWKHRFRGQLRSGCFALVPSCASTICTHLISTLLLGSLQESSPTFLRWPNSCLCRSLYGAPHLVSSN